MLCQILKQIIFNLKTDYSPWILWCSHFLFFLNISKKMKNKTKNQLYFFYFIKMDLKSCDLYFLYTQENIVNKTQIKPSCTWTTICFCAFCGLSTTLFPELTLPRINQKKKREERNNGNSSNTERTHIGQWNRFQDVCMYTNITTHKYIQKCARICCIISSFPFRKEG